MFAQIPLFPQQASTSAAPRDAIFFFILAVTGFVAVLVSVLIFFFAIKYRRRSEHDRTPRILGSIKLELFWTIVPMFFFLAMFVVGAVDFFNQSRPPDDAMEIYVVGKQWMWKIQHPEGQREINTLHIPVNRAVKLTLTSEDVIHDFFVPEFRTHVDVIPGRYVRTWFQPTKEGTYHLFCSQYCGTNHAGMIGSVIVMKRSDYEAWLNSSADGSLAVQGRKLFLKLQCITCHNPRSQRAPILEDLYGSTVNLEKDGPVIANEDYITESILKPNAKIVQGYQPIMPTFEGQLADPEEGLDQEEALIRLVAYIKSLKAGQTPVRTDEFPPPIGAPTTPPGEQGKKP